MNHNMKQEQMQQERSVPCKPGQEVVSDNGNRSECLEYKAYLMLSSIISPIQGKIWSCFRHEAVSMLLGIWPTTPGQWLAGIPQSTTASQSAILENHFF